ncbi:MAG: IPT/TIG domain-containing protein [Thermoleophilaceae bacterium]
MWVWRFRRRAEGLEPESRGRVRCPALGACSYSDGKEVPVTAVTVADVAPKPLPVVANQALRITGSGFLSSAAAGGGVWLDNQPLAVESWSDSLIFARIPPGMSGNRGAASEPRITNSTGYAGVIELATADEGQ